MTNGEGVSGIVSWFANDVVKWIIENPWMLLLIILGVEALCRIYDLGEYLSQEPEEDWDEW